MANKTVNRYPFSVPISKTNDGFFNHVNFKGMCDDKNEAKVDQETFADVKNMYVNEQDLLVSRPALKRANDVTHIIGEWSFGNIGLRLIRVEAECVLQCMTHTTVDDESNGKYGEMRWTVSGTHIPTIKFVQIEDRIFIWFDNIDFVAFNTSGLYFEYASEYLYTPVHELVINGIESELESKNFLTEKYRRRHQYSATSAVNFETLTGKDMSVYLNRDDKRKFLYDLNIQKNQDKVVVYLYSIIGNNYYVDVVHTPRTNVMMRYSAVLNTIEVSFGGEIFTPVQSLSGIIGNPLLTKDGLWLVAFTTSGLAKCRLVAQDSIDFVIDTTLTWTVEPYMARVIYNGVPITGVAIDNSFVPVGHFETIDTFAYIISCSSITGQESGNVQYLYAEWLSGLNETQYNYAKVDTPFTSDELKLHFRYVAPTVRWENPSNIAAVMRQDGVLNYTTLLPAPKPVSRPIVNNDYIKVGNASFFINRLTTDAKQKNTSATHISVGDIVSLTNVPVPSTSIPAYNSSTVYSMNQTVYVGDTIYICIQNGSGHAPNSSPLWWRSLGQRTISWHYNKYEPTGDSWIANISLTANSFLNENIRFVVTKKDGTSGIIYPGDDLIFTPYLTPVRYSQTEMASIFGAFPSPFGVNHNWSIIFPGYQYYENSPSYVVGEIVYYAATDKMYQCIQNATGIIPTNTAYWVHIDDGPWGYNAYVGGSSRSGITYVREYISNPSLWKNTTLLDTINHNGTNYTPVSLTSSVRRFDLNILQPIMGTNNIQYDIVLAYNVLCSDDTQFDVYKNIRSTNTFSSITKTQEVVQDNSKYFKISSNNTDVLTDKYQRIDGEIVKLPDNGELSLRATDTERLISNNNLMRLGTETDAITRNIHRLTADGMSLSPAKIQSGDKVAYVVNAENASDYLSGDKYTILRESPGDIRNGDSVQLIHLTQDYPAQPGDWSVGDDWPWDIMTKPPLWEVGDALPIGRIHLYGTATIEKRVIPLLLSEYPWYLIDGTLWTSTPIFDGFLELDETINSDATIRKEMPDYSAILNETFISFVTEDNKYLLQVTATRRDENTGDFLLYLPKINEIKFSRKITNLHTLSENDMGVFTEDEVWYIQTLLNDYGSVSALTKPVKSKLPIGCRDGSDIITALDGKAIVFTTYRGITILSPQDFVATTEQTITYLSDVISQKYNRFYNDKVYNAMLMPNEHTETIPTAIKIINYKYWILFYRYMDREILLFDTRSSAWWVWTTPYPIKSMRVDTNLYILMQIDLNPITNGDIVITPDKTLLGLSFVLADETDVTYHDELYPGAIDGTISPTKDVHRVYYPEARIHWSLMSQRLHFNQINNYKLIKAINLTVKGDTTQTAKFSTKCFRDFYHPEKSEVTEIKINNLRTFVQRMNLMRVINFQYTLETDLLNDEQSQLVLNSITVKYELKERIR